MKKPVNLITISRVIMAISLLFIEPMTAFFYVIYALCIVSDIADGPIARKTKTASNLGALFDSIADLIFIAIVLIIFLPHPGFPLKLWMLYGVGLVIVTRLIAFAIGFKKYRTLTLLHTYSNKAAGLIMACFPLYFELWDINVMFIIVFAAAYLSALEEFVITIRSKELNRNIKSMFDKE